MINKFSFQLALKAMFNRKELSEAAQKKEFLRGFLKRLCSHILIGGKQLEERFVQRLELRFFKKPQRVQFA